MACDQASLPPILQQTLEVLLGSCRITDVTITESSSEFQVEFNEKWSSLTAEQFVMLTNIFKDGFSVEATLKYVGHCSNCNEAEPHLQLNISKDSIPVPT